MKTWKLTKRKLVNGLLLVSVLLLGVVWLSKPQTKVTAQTWTIVATAAKPPFVLRNYGGKCLDCGAPPQITGAPVFIYDCNGTLAQEVRIEEVNAQHDVIL